MATWISYRCSSDSVIISIVPDGLGKSSSSKVTGDDVFKRTLEEEFKQSKLSYSQNSS